MFQCAKEIERYSYDGRSLASVLDGLDGRRLYTMGRCSFCEIVYVWKRSRLRLADAVCASCSTKDAPRLLKATTRNRKHGIRLVIVYSNGHPPVWR